MVSFLHPVFLILKVKEVGIPTNTDPKLSAATVAFVLVVPFTVKLKGTKSNCFPGELLATFMESI